MTAAHENLSQYNPGQDETTQRRRFADDPPAPEHPNLVEAMRHRLKTFEGKAVHVRGKSPAPAPFF